LPVNYNRKTGAKQKVFPDRWAKRASEGQLVNRLFFLDNAVGGYSKDKTGTEHEN
jgi:hypothetical protein